MLITNHWSGTSNVRIRDYHLEYALLRTLDAAFIKELEAAKTPSDVDWKKLKSLFHFWKNFDLHSPTTYGTYEMNHDPRDSSSNVEIGALCMGGENVSTTGSWGAYPFTIGHAWIAAGLSARVAAVCDIDLTASFAPTGSTFQNGPIFNVSTHAERAWQTYSPDAKDHELGYLLWSGDNDCRWDLAVLKQSDQHELSSASGTVSAVRASASWLRNQAHLIKAQGISDFWGVDKGLSL